VTHMIKYNNNSIINIFIIYYIAETCDLHACRHYYGISCYDEIYKNSVYEFYLGSNVIMTSKDL